MLQFQSTPHPMLNRKFKVFPNVTSFAHQMKINLTGEQGPQTKHWCYLDYQLSKAQRNVGDRDLTFNLSHCHWQMAPHTTCDAVMGNWLHFQWQLIGLWSHWQHNAGNCRQQYCCHRKDEERCPWQHHNIKSKTFSQKLGSNLLNG